VKILTAMPLLALGLVAVAGCGSSSDPTAPKPSPAAHLDRDPGPELTVPGGPPTKKLVATDLKVGHGPPAERGSEVTIQYVGKLWSGTSYSDSWRYPTAPSFTLGKGQLIVGFDRGIRGMRAGGRRMLLVPRNLDIFPGTPVTPGSSALVFLVDMVKVHPR
jgi:peptidylprolyl isomerase